MKTRSDIFQAWALILGFFCIAGVFCPVSTEAGNAVLSVKSRDTSPAAGNSSGVSNRGQVRVSFLSNRGSITNSVSSNVIAMTNKSVKKSAVLIIEHADNMEYFKVDGLQEEIVKIRGRVIISYKSLHLKADAVTVNMQTKNIYGWGNINFLDGGQAMVGDSFLYDMKTDRGVVYNGSSLIGKLIYSGEEIKTLDRNFYKINNGYFSTCALHDPHYSLGVKKIWIYPDGSFFILHITYLVADVPLFYFPFAFRTMKGTGIITYAGYNSERGWFIQNNYGFPLKNLFDVSLRADYYQFKGLYGGVSLKSSSKYSSSDISFNVANDRILQPNGAYDNLFRYYHNIRQEFILSQTGTSSTKIQLYYFNTSDNAFTRDYIANRATRGGLAVAGLDSLARTYPDYTYYGSDSYYINIQDIRPNSSLSVQNTWGVQWNPVMNKFVLTSISLPSINYSLGHSLSFFEKSTNASFAENALDFLVNGFSWNAGFSLQNIKYYDYSTEAYTESQLYRDIRINVSKQFNLANFLIYNPGVSVGDRETVGKDVTEYEKNNFDRMSYTYLNYNESLTMNIHTLFRINGFTSSFNISRYLSLDLSKKYPSEYGGYTGHAGTARYSFSLPWFTYSLSTSANLLVRTNQHLDLLDRNLYNNLQQNAGLSLFKVVSINDSYSYSIKDRQPVRNAVTFSVSGPAFRIFGMEFTGLALSTLLDYNFINPYQSYFSSSFSLNLEPVKSLKLSFSVNSRNNKLYMYSRELLAQYGMNPELYRNVFTDLLDSFDFFDIEKRRRTNFKLKGISVNLSHDLHCWRLSAGYSLYQNYVYIPYYNNFQYPYWEHSLWVQINIIDFESVQYKTEQHSTPPVFQ
jgi:hypothetical protein